MRLRLSDLISGELDTRDWHVSAHVSAFLSLVFQLVFFRASGETITALLFTSMGAGSVLGVVFIFPWLRARFSADFLTLSANLLIIIAYALMALVRQTETFLIFAALAGMGWTLSASELWVAAQRAMPSWARGRMNATVIMISQGAMVLGGVIWGSAAAIGGATSALFGAAILFLLSLLLAGRLSINFTREIPITYRPLERGGSFRSE